MDTKRRKFPQRNKICQSDLELVGGGEKLWHRSLEKARELRCQRPKYKVGQDETLGGEKKEQVLSKSEELVSGMLGLKENIVLKK